MGRAQEELLAWFCERCLEDLAGDAAACAAHACSHIFADFDAACGNAELVDEMEHAASLGVELELVPHI